MKTNLELLKTDITNGDESVVLSRIDSLKSEDFCKDSKVKPAHEMIEMGMIGALKKLLEKFPGLMKQTDSQGLSLLATAITYQSEEATLFLLQKDAGLLNYKDLAGKNILHKCAFSEKLVEYILGQKPDLLTSRDYEKKTALHYAAEEGNVGVGQLLLNRSEEGWLNSQSTQRETPLHVAVGSGKVDFIKLLIKNGADINVKNLQNKSPKELSIAWTNELIRNLLSTASLADSIFDKDAGNSRAITKIDFAVNKDLFAQRLWSNVEQRGMPTDFANFIESLPQNIQDMILTSFAAMSDDEVSKISSMITDFSLKTFKPHEKAIILCGKTGSGKSTTAYLLAGKKLEAITDKETADIHIVAKDPVSDVIISEKMHQEFVLPGALEYQGVKIWDWQIPDEQVGNVTEQILQNYYIYRIAKTAQQAKFVICSSYSDINNKSNELIKTIANLIDNFDDIDLLANSLAFVVTKVPAHVDETKYINNKVDRLIKSQEALDPKVEKALSYLLKNIYIFNEPKNEGELDLKSPLDSLDNFKFIDVGPELLNLYLDCEAGPKAEFLLESAKIQVNKIVNLVTKALAEPTKPELWSENYSKLVQRHLPSSFEKKLPIKTTPLSETGEFVDIARLAKINKTLHQLVEDGKATLTISAVQSLLKVLAEFSAEPEQIMLQKYNYVLVEHCNKIEFFSKLCAKKYKEFLPFVEVQQLIQKSDHLLKTQIYELQLEQNQSHEYYDTALVYMRAYPDYANPSTKALAYKYIADIYKTNGDNKLAVWFYEQAIKADKSCDVYKTLGELYLQQGYFEKAIGCFKIVDNFAKVRECYKKLIKQYPENIQIKIAEADYLALKGYCETASMKYRIIADETGDKKYLLKVADLLDVKHSLQKQIVQDLREGASGKKPAIDFKIAEEFVSDLGDQELVGDLFMSTSE